MLYEVITEGTGMLGVPGMAARIFGAVATTGATVPLITEASSEQSLVITSYSIHYTKLYEEIENITILLFIC